MTKSITITCTPLRFYAQNDEAAFFAWLNKIQAIKNVKGIGGELYLEFPSSQVSHKDLLDLIGLFRRYNFDEKQLAVFKNENNKELFETVS